MIRSYIIHFSLKDCQDETDHGGYCRKMFSNGTIVTTYCTEKTYSICIEGIVKLYEIHRLEMFYRGFNKL